MGAHRKRNKIGRNDPCHCGSGQKFKRCHGTAASAFIVPPAGSLDEALRHKLEELRALQLQREQQQGLGRPIVSTTFRGYRLVAVGSRLYHSKNWKTFHDFLFDYIKLTLGQEWGNLELRKPETDRHPILQWYGLVCQAQRDSASSTPGGIRSALATGAVEAYLGLAYNLYLLAHNVELQERFIKRLKDPLNFTGACYETYVAAAFIKAGFRLALEDEADPSRSHCEFDATYPATGRRFSVEAKARRPGKANAKVHLQLHAALKKQTSYTRVVFIDVNVPDSATEGESGGWLREALADIRKKEPTMMIDGEAAPPAYVFLTNHPYHYTLESTLYRRSPVSEGFKIPDFRLDASFASIRDALVAREKHHEMFRLMASVRDHYEIPSTFDGAIPEFAFGGAVPRLRIGHSYLVPLADGTEVPGVLSDATVLESEAAVYGAYKLADGRSIIVSTPMTPQELSAYRRHPDTFFGVRKDQGKRIDDPLDLFDRAFETYRHSSKEKLLEFMSGWPDSDHLKHIEQKELAIKYCENLVYAMMAQKAKGDQAEQMKL